MKYIYKSGLYLAVLAILYSCAENEPLEFMVDKPESVAIQEEIDAYDPLISYVENGSMLGAGGISLSTYVEKGVPYRLINSNFNEITVNSGMNHGDVVLADGSLETSKVEDYLNMTNEAGIAAFGHALTWHKGQNAEFLNSTIAPTIIPATGGPTWEVITSNDFETADASNYQSNSNAVMSFTADGEGANGTGRALMINNAEVRANDWDAQFFITFAPNTQLGEVYKLTMDVRADEAVSFPTQAHVVPYQYKHWNFFGAVNASTAWTTFEVEITITAETAEVGAIAFNLGAVATNYYFDNISLTKFNESGGGPTWDIMTANDFETADASNYTSNSNAVMSFTADGTGANGTGRALMINNAEVRANDWDAQFFITFSPNTELGQKYRLSMDVKADVAVSYPTQAHVVPYQYKHWNFFGAINATTEWTHISVEITADANTSEVGAIAFNLGATATNYYFDNIELSWYNEAGGQEEIIEMTPEEKFDTLSFHLENWIAGMMTASKENVNAWNVVNEPLDDDNPTALRSGAGKELADDEFYWQDYLGDDYAVIAFNLARENAKQGDLLFINESNLEADLAKCKSLVDYVAYIEGKGAAVDGIGTEMHLDLNTDKDNIVQMFQMLAATGKKIRISELNVTIGEQNPPAELYLQQAEMYKYVVDMYKANVPADQRYGITVWGATDFDDTLLQGLWNGQFTRKAAYSSFAEGLSK